MPIVEKMTDEEVEQVFMILWNVVHRQVTDIWESVRDSLISLAEERAELEGIPYEQAVDEVTNELINGDYDEDEGEDE